LKKTQFHAAIEIEEPKMMTGAKPSKKASLFIPFRELESDWRNLAREAIEVDREEKEELLSVPAEKEGGRHKS
jgi:hypothetical protein